MTTTRALVLIGAIGMAACDGERAALEPQPDAAIESTPDAEVPDAAPATYAEWTESDVFPVRVDHHTTFIHGDGLYVVGGVTSDDGEPTSVQSAIRRAAIADDGSLGAFEEITTIPFPLAFHAQTVDGDHAYFLGGVSENEDGLFAADIVIVADLAADGSITLRDGEAVGANRAFLHATASVLGRSLYLIGGTNEDPTADVFVATLDETGTPTAWSKGPELPSARTHHAAVVRDGAIYLIGGMDGEHAPIGDILRSTLDDSGAVTGWEVAGTIESAPWTHAAFVYEDALFVLGGGEGGHLQERYVDRLRRAAFEPDGTLGAFEDWADPLPVARAHVHHAPVRDGRIYSVGGRLESLDSTDRVFIGALR